jgi:KDO2-lipid IV(A) lauroyltransferase
MADDAHDTAGDRFDGAHGRDRGPLDYLLYLLFRALLLVLTAAPEWAVARLIDGLSLLASRVDRRHSLAARDFLRTARPELEGAELDAAVVEAYRHFFRVIVESQRLMARVPRERMLERFDYHLAPGTREVLERDGGVIYFGAHLGNWEALTLAVQLYGAHEFHGVAKPVKNYYISRFVLEQRLARGVRMLPRRGAMVEAPGILKGGGGLAVLLDQRARVKPVLAPFFGRTARCDRTAGVLVRRLRVPLVPMVCYRTERPLHFRVEFGPVILPEELAGKSPEEVATRINAELERMIRAAPEQYFWLHDRFRDAP